jgi:hypothetical protein
MPKTKRQTKRQTKDTATKVKEHKPGVEIIRVLQSVRIIVKDKNNIAKRSNNTLALRVSKIEQDETDIKHSLLEQQTEQDIKQNLHIPIMRLCTHEQIKKMIHHIIKDNLSVKEASRRANMSATSALKYYKKYVEDPEHNIPIPYNCANRSPKKCTQGQINALIGYIVNDKMSLATASVKADMGEMTGRKYYEIYLKNHIIPTPRMSQPLGKSCTEKQIKEFIHSITHDKLTITAASHKARITRNTGSKYYNKYLTNPDSELTLQKQKVCRPKCCTQEQVKCLVGYIDDDKMSIRSASAKAGMNERTGRRYYKRYLDDPNHEIPVPLKYVSRPKRIKEE